MVQQAALSEAPARYGYDFTRLGQAWSDASPPELPPSSSSLTAGEGNDDAFANQLASMEIQHGPYSDTLAEPLTSLAQHYRQRGQYAAALAHYQRALHVVRVNDGLYSERQVPLVRGQLDTFRLAGDFNGLDERYEYFFRLYGSGQPPYTDLRLRAALEFLRWQREALRRRIGEDSEARLLNTYQLNEDILDAAGQSDSISPQGYEQLVLSQIRNLYLIQTEITPIEDPYLLGSASPMNTSSVKPMDFHEQRMQSLLRHSVARGKWLLEDLETRLQQSGDSTGAARVQLELGDWLQWNRQYYGAREAYAQVRNILANSGHTELIEQWLGEPVELPANGAFWQPEEPSDDSPQFIFATNYDVNTRGDARNIRVAAAAQAGEAYSSRLKRKLATTRFRPRFVSGEAEAVQKLSRKYQMRVD